VTKKRSLTGIKPTGLPHIGNYLGAIKPALNYTNNYDCYYFIADYHALTTNKGDIASLSLEVAATWLALGLDTTKSIFYKQSDVPEIFECHWILSCFAQKGLLNRAHAYKACVDDNIAKQKDPDDNINHGLYSYPVLMAADILLFDTDIVPVGADQKQHVEIARDIAQNVNKVHKDLFTLPEPFIEKETPVIVGTDGQKMSKNYTNTLPLFLPEKALRKQVMKIVTDSTPVEEPKDTESCTVFKLYSYFATDGQLASLKANYEKGGYGYGHAKQALFELLLDYFGPARKRYADIMADPSYIQKELKLGAEKARNIAAKKLALIKRKLGT